MENTNVNLIIHLYVKSELCLKFRKYDPMGCRKVVKADQKGSPKRFPEEHSEPQGAIWCPGGYNNNGQAPQRPTEAEKDEKP